MIGSAARRELRSLDGEVIDEKLDDLPREGIQSIFEIDITWLWLQKSQSL